MSEPIKRALISVSDKTGIVEFARQLQTLGIEILSTGGTAQLLKQHNIITQEIAEYTGFPEIMSGRVKTLHPKVHGGLLGRRGIDDEVMKNHHIFPIDLLVVNLYPFSQTIANPNCSLAEAIEQIDIGGPTMLRSAAKNFQHVSVIIDPQDYETVLMEIKQHHATSLETRYRLAKKVFAHTANYDAIISNYLGTHDLNGEVHDFPETYTIQFSKKEDMRYGENPHQKAAFYLESLSSSVSISTAKQTQGKALSYNNVADANAALETVKRFKDSACVIVKHANPCGVAVAANQLTAYQRAFAADPTSAFGGIIAFNENLQAETAEQILANQFVEAIIAPEVSSEALTILATKPNIRVLSCGSFSQAKSTYWNYLRVNGGLLVQEADLGTLNPSQLKIVSKREPTSTEMDDLLFAWEVVKDVKSNAIVYAKDRTTIGIGAGQMSRVFSANIALLKAKEAGFSTQGAVMASDAFFPFRDGIDIAAQASITAIISPGGSIRDEDVIQAANEANIAMIFTGMRHFKH